MWLFKYAHDYLTSMTFRLYMTLCTTSLGLPRYITLTENIAHRRDVDDMTHDMTHHDSASTFVLLLECMSSCNAARWWMSSGCITTSPSHGKVCGVFDSFGVCLMSHMHVSPSLVLDMLHVFIRPRASLLACAPCSSRSSLHHVSPMHLYLRSIMMR